MKFVSSLSLLLLMSPACLAEPPMAKSPVYTTSEGKSIPIPDGVLDSTTHCGLNLGACSKNKENDFCRDIIGFSGTRTMMDFLAGHNERLGREVAKYAGVTNQYSHSWKKSILENTEQIASYAKKKKGYIQRFVAVGLTRSQINNIPFPERFSRPDFYDSQEFRCKNVSQPSTPLYTAVDGSSSPIPNGVLDPKTDCGLNLQACWAPEEHKWGKQNAFCSDIKKLAGLKNEMKEKGEIDSLTSQQQNYTDALEAIGLTQEQIKNIPAYGFEDQKQNMDQYFYCRTNSTPNKPPKKTFKEKVASFFKGNKGQK